MAVIIETLLKKIEYEALLKKEDDYAQRWENVKELINFSTIVAQAGVAVPYTRELASDEEGEEDGMDYEAEVGDVTWGSTAATIISEGSQSPLIKSEGSEGTSSRASKLKRKTYEVIDLASPSEGEEDVKPVIKKSKKRERAAVKPTMRVKAEKKTVQVEVASIDDEEETGGSSVTLGEDGSNEEAKTPLRVFLEASTLSTDMEQDDQDGKSPKVTIATTHAAKG